MKENNTKQKQSSNINKDNSGQLQLHVLLTLLGDQCYSGARTESQRKNALQTNPNSEQNQSIKNTNMLL